MINVENTTLELYVWLNERKKINVDDFRFLHVVEAYKRNEIYHTFSCSYSIIRHNKQKMVIAFEEITKLVCKIVKSIPKIHLTDKFYSSSYSEINTGAYLYIDYSNIKQVVKIAYLDTRIAYDTSIVSERGSSNDYESDDFHDEPAVYTSNIDKWFHFIIEKGLPLYTREYVKKNKIEYPYFYESLIELPYNSFFDSFFDKVVYYWRILKETGFITDSWEVLEKSKQVVDEMRIKLQNIE